MKQNRNSPRLSEGLFTRMIRDVPSGGVRYSTVCSREKKKFPFLLVTASLLITAMLMFLVFSFVSVSELQNKVNAAESRLRELEETVESKEREINTKYGDIHIEEEAEKQNMTDSEKILYLPCDAEEMTSEVLYRKKTVVTTLLSAAQRSFSKVIGFLS